MLSRVEGHGWLTFKVAAMVLAMSSMSAGARDQVTFSSKEVAFRQGVAAHASLLQSGSIGDTFECSALVGFLNELAHGERLS
jgi:hypothetical protein